MVQRRRADLRNYLEEATSFPERLETEASYHLSEEGHALLDAALAYARETVRDESTDRHRQRMQFWAVLALLRSLVSSPAAAIDTLEKRVSNIDGSSDEDAEDTSRRHVMDLGDEDGEDYDDETGPADIALDAGTSGRSRRLKELARLAKSMEGENDRKLSGLVDMVGQLLAEGCNPIVFCRYIPTVDYVARELRARFPDIGVAGVSGRVPASERPQVVAELEDWDQRVLVASDCLAEGINLQGHFDAVVHYDLAWNPTRHEQREGRVDRLGQPKSEVKVITYFGADNKIDGHVLEVLHRKSKRIRTMLGYSVPIPGKGDAVAEAIMTGLLLKDPDDSDQLVFEGMDTRAQVVLDEWEAAAENERKSRTLFAQRGIDPDEVANELAEVRAALGTTATVQRFVTSALLASGAHVDGEDPIDVDLTHTPLALREAVNAARDPMASMHFGADEADTTGHLTRTHPFVGGLASYVLDTALDPLQEGPAARAGVVRTDAVTVRTTLLVVRYRFDVVLERGARQLLAEDAGVHAYTGSAESPRWLEDDEVEALLHAEPAGNVSREQAREFLGAAIDGLPGLASVLEGMATQSAGRILDSHDRVRSAARVSTAGDRVDALLPTDILGVYVLLPASKA
jgi:hypothetical protein